MEKFAVLGSAEDIEEGSVRVYQVGTREIAVFHIQGRYYAVDNVCPHRGGPIAEGERKGTVVTCPWHAWSFEVTTGQCTFHAAARLETFAVRVEEGKLKIQL